MIGLYVSIPFACFRKGMAREYLETEPLPPPSTCYGFLLALVGEMDRRRHIGCRVTASLVGNSEISVVLRTVWRVKKTPLGSSGNSRPDYQQLLSNVELVLWLDSTDESPKDGMTLEHRVQKCLENPAEIDRFGGLSIGESTHLVNDVLPVERAHFSTDRSGQIFVVDENGRLTLPVWVDHVGSAGTRYVTGNLQQCDPKAEPTIPQIPQITSGP